MTEKKVTNIDMTRPDYIEAGVLAITKAGKGMYEPYGRILALRDVELSLYKLIKDINIEVNKQQAIVDKHNKDNEDKENG